MIVCNCVFTTQVRHKTGAAIALPLATRIGLTGPLIIQAYMPHQYTHRGLNKTGGGRFEHIRGEKGGNCIGRI